MQALVKLSGSQYLVNEGDRLTVNLLDFPEGDKFAIKEVLLVVDGKKTHIGSPLVKGAEVECEVMRHYLGKKVVVFKHKRRKDYTRTRGHRQRLSDIRVKSITIGSQ